VTLALFFFFVFAATASASGSKGGKPPKSTSAPTISIAAPSAGSTVSGRISVSGTASDSSTSLASIKISVDGGAYHPASGTASWTFALDTTSYPDGAHAIAAKVTDSAGSTAVTTDSVTFSNSPTSPPPPPPLPPPDTSPPSVSISSPAPSGTVSGTVSVSGSASDNVSVATVQVSVDGGAYQTAQGASSWSYSLDTMALSNGSHTLAARATDTSGNVSTANESVIVQNTTPLPPGVVDQLVTPEGATIQVYSGVTGWTAQQIYDLLKPNAYQLSLIGPHYTIKVQTQYVSSTTTSVSGDAATGYSNYQATTYLNTQAGSNFTLIPDAIIAHEYGAAWSLYHLYMTEDGKWDSYFQARGITGDPRIDSNYMWNRGELIAEDYRLLLGTSAAQSEMAQMNYQIPDARQVAGLKDFLASSW
jgi:hypothetical protein